LHEHLQQLVAAHGYWAIALVVGLESMGLHPSHALRVIESISVIVGGAVGSVIVLLLLIILWPTASNWIINTFLWIH
jgi:hypothetical protein